MQSLGCSPGASSNKQEAMEVPDFRDYCTESCAYEWRTITVCNEGIPSYDEGYWSSNCVSGPCAGVDLDTSDLPDPLVPCSSYKEFRFEQDVFADCDNWNDPVDPALVDGGPDTVAYKAIGATCTNDSECASARCMTIDDQHMECVEGCEAGACPNGFFCSGGTCMSTCMSR